MLNVEALPRCLVQERRVAVGDEAAARRERQLRASLLNSGHQETQHSSPEATIFTGFTAARVMASISAGATREAPTCCDPKSP